MTYRHPGLLAKIITTLDVLSNGRAVLGLGAAWYEREHLGLGVPYPSTAERFERLEETLQIVGQMWSDEQGPYERKHSGWPDRLRRRRSVDRRSSSAVRASARHSGGRPVRRSLQPVPGRRATSTHAGRVDDHSPPRDAILPRRRGRSSPPNRVADPDAFRAEVEMLAGLGISMVWTGPSRAVADPVGWVTELCERRLPELTHL